MACVNSGLLHAVHRRELTLSRVADKLSLWTRCPIIGLTKLIHEVEN
jgi:hypothetical protein